MSGGPKSPGFDAILVHPPPVEGPLAQQLKASRLGNPTKTTCFQFPVEMRGWVGSGVRNDQNTRSSCAKPALTDAVAWRIVENTWPSSHQRHSATVQVRSANKLPPGLLVSASPPSRQAIESLSPSRGAPRVSPLLRHYSEGQERTTGKRPKTPASCERMPSCCNAIKRVGTRVRIPRTPTHCGWARGQPHGICHGSRHERPTACRWRVETV